MKVMFNILLSFNATSFLVIIFMVKNGHTIDFFFGRVPYLEVAPEFVSYILYVIIPVILTWISIRMTSLLGEDEFKENDIVEIECVDNIFMPSYLGYFFVAVSINEWGTLIFVYGLLFIFTFLSQALYFNPIFLAFRYGFYNAKTSNGAVIFLISKKSYKTPKEVVIDSARRVNDYTYIEGGKL